MISHGHETLAPDPSHQCNEEDRQVDSGHSWQDDFQRGITFVNLVFDQVFCGLDLFSIDLAFNLSVTLFVHFG